MTDARWALEVMPTGRPGELRLAGDFDMGNAEDIAAILGKERERAPGAALRLDLSTVTFMDSTGLKVLLNLAASGPVVIVRPSRVVKRLFEVAIPYGAPGLEIA